MAIAPRIAATVAGSGTILSLTVNRPFAKSPSRIWAFISPSCESISFAISSVRFEDSAPNDSMV